MEVIIGPRSNRYTIEEPVTEVELSNIVNDSKIKVLQTKSDLARESWERINSIVLKDREDIVIRLFGFYSSVCDISQIKSLQNVRRLSIDCIESAINIDVLKEFKCLESLTIGVYNLKSFDFLEDVYPNLVELSLQETKSRKIDISIVSRFCKLERLSIGCHTKGIEVLNQLKTLKTLTLNSISAPNLSFINQLEGLEFLTVNLGGIKDFTYLEKFPNLKYLELFQVRELGNLDFLSNQKSLQYVYLQNMPNIKSMPDMLNMINLRRLVIDNLKGLSDFKSLIDAPMLEEFCLYQGSKQGIEDISVVLRNKSLKRVVAYFGSEKKNRAFKDLVIKAGLDNCIDIGVFDYQ